MAVNKVIYDNNTLIDLTSDTVVPETLRRGYTAHKADGTTITGINGDGFSGYPEVEKFYDEIQDSDEDILTDDTGDTVWGTTVYRKA